MFSSAAPSKNYINLQLEAKSRLDGQTHSVGSNVTLTYENKNVVVVNPPPPPQKKKDDDEEKLVKTTEKK